MNDTSNDIVAHDVPPETDGAETGGWARVIIAELAVVAMILVGVAVLVRGASGADPHDSVAAPKPAPATPLPRAPTVCSLPRVAIAGCGPVSGSPRSPAARNSIGAKPLQ